MTESHFCTHRKMMLALESNVNSRANSVIAAYYCYDYSSLDSPKTSWRPFPF